MATELRPVANAPAQVTKLPPHPQKENGRWSGYLHLLGARMRELQREPEIVFWVFMFPLLLALGLGIAFRNKPANVPSVAIVSGPAAQQAFDMLHRSPAKIKADILDSYDAHNRFRLGKYD